jgi:hypothetical protein
MHIVIAERAERRYKYVFTAAANEKLSAARSAPPYAKPAHDGKNSA